MSRLPQLQEAIADATKTLQSLLDLDVQLGQAADAIKECLRSGNKLLVCGNGGSAADAAHFATAFACQRYGIDVWTVKVERFGQLCCLSA